jgi:hypothetical protein
MFVYCVGFGVITCLTSHVGTIPALFAISLLYGLNSGSIDAGLMNVDKLNQFNLSFEIINNMELLNLLK